MIGEIKCIFILCAIYKNSSITYGDIQKVFLKYSGIGEGRISTMEREFRVTFFVEGGWLDGKRRLQSSLKAVVNKKRWVTLGLVPGT